MTDAGTSAAKSGKRKTILIIEDSAVQTLALEELLEREGLGVLCAANGRVGVEMAQQHAPDAIVLDLKMPEMDGFEACRQLKQDPQTANIPVIMLTSFADQASSVLEGLTLGAVDFIPKDAFSDKVLLETLRQLKIL